MQVVILAGGLGTRLRSTIGEIPKALAPVAGRPFIEHQFELLREQGLTHVLLSIGHLGHMIRTHVGDGSAFGMRVRYVEEDPTRLLGTGGALVRALPELEEAFLTLYGDSYLPTDYRALIAAFERSRLPALMSVFKNDGRWDHSNTRTDGVRVTFYSKQAAPGEADYIDYGLSAFKRSVIEAHAGSAMPLDMAVIQRELVEQGHMAAFVVHERFYEIGKPEGLEELDALLGDADTRRLEPAYGYAPAHATPPNENAAPRPTVFLDRDGTLNEMVYDETHGTMDSPRRPDQVRAKPGAGAFLAELKRRGYVLCVVTNQPGMAKGTLTLEQLDAVNRELARQLKVDGGAWDALLYCPHHPEAGPHANMRYVGRCACRKPEPGLLLRAATDLKLDPAQSWMIGDGLNDMQAGRRAGCRSILLAKLKIEHVERFFHLKDTRPDAVAADFDQALKAMAS